MGLSVSPQIVVPELLEEIILGVYIGLLTGIFPALVAFSFGFGFKYLTNVTVPGLGVVVLGGALAGISGGLMGVMSPEIAESWTGITAVVVILMASLWAHSVGDALGAKTPRTLTLQRIKKTRLSADLVERVDMFGQIRVHPVGEIQDIEGYPPLPDDLHETLRNGSWKFPSTLPLPEIERRLEATLLDEYELAEVLVTVDRRGRAHIAAAPATAGLSRRIPSGKRAVSIRSLLPTGMARGDIVSIGLPNGSISGPVVSARTDGHETESRSTGPPLESSTLDETASTAAEGTTAPPPAPPKAPTTTGGEGQVTVAVSPTEARRIIDHEHAPAIVRARGIQREYELIAVLTEQDNRFRKVTLAADCELVGQTIGQAAVVDEYGVVILAISRPQDVIIAPRGKTMLHAGDELIVVGPHKDLRGFAEVAK